MNFREQIWCVVSEEMSFETFIPMWSNVNENEKKLAKIQNLKFHSSLNNFGRDPPYPRSMHDFLGVNLVCTFRGDVV